ncbi:hypothetical protein B0H11DRAFT_1022599 [Mycena galericulata]|nr:hypothetical protein B0H11DRAFT_1022599 [Mycena galericulata]
MPPPKSLLLLNLLSLIVATLTFLISLLDLGILSLWMDPIASLFTIIYHSTLLLMSYNCPKSSVMHSVPAIALAYLLSFIWLGAFAVMVIISYGQGNETQINVFSMNVQFPDHFQLTQQFQLLLAPLEFSLLGDIAIRSTLQRRKLPECPSLCISRSSREASHGGILG